MSTIIIAATEKDVPEIRTLLRKIELPDCGIEERIQNFFIARQDDAIIGVIGLIVSEKHGLLRSLAVQADFRNRGIAARLLNMAIQQAVVSNVDSLYLLTGTAKDYFLHKRFHSLEYSQFPLELLQAAGMENVCTACHDCLTLRLTDKGNIRAAQLANSSEIAEIRKAN